MAPQLAWIGLGNMGQGMCKNLVEKGSLSHPLIIYNRTVSKAESLSKKIRHSTIAPSIESAVSKSDIIFLCLGDDASVEENVDKMLQTDGGVRGKLFVDCSTIHPDTTAKIAKQIESKGASFVACPVFGAPPMAEAGQLVCVLAGSKEAVEKVKPFCKGVMGREIIDFSGQEPSKATLMKVLGNTFILSMIENLAEGHVVAEKSGLGTENLHQFVSLMFPGPYTIYSKRMISGDYYQRETPAFAAQLARKDARHAQDVANKAGVELNNVKIGDGLLEKAYEMKGDKADIAGMYGAKRTLSGLPYENQ